MTYYFRELQNQQEMLEFLHLRYTRYARAHGADFLAANEHELDLDHYDLRSRHYGLFVEESDQQKLIGGLRIIQNKPVLATIRMLRNMGLLDQSIVSTESKVLPILSHFEDHGSEAFNDLLENATFASEGSRLVLKEEYQSLRLAKFIISNAIILHLNRKEEWVAFVTCRPLHARLYQSYGFDHVCDTTANMKHVPVKALYLRRETLAEHQREELEIMAAAYQAEGFTRYVHERKVRALRTA